METPRSSRTSPRPRLAASTRKDSRRFSATSAKLTFPSIVQGLEDAGFRCARRNGGGEETAAHLTQQPYSYNVF